jgi:phosphoenolpyruvate carboxylase
MAPRLVALHATRLSVMHRIWLTAMHIPDFRPQVGLTREALIERILRLDMQGSLALLDEIFPQTPDPSVGLDFGEPAGPRESHAYETLHREVFDPMRQLFALLRELSGAIQHEVGAFG